MKMRNSMRKKLSRSRAAPPPQFLLTVVAMALGKLSVHLKTTLFLAESVDIIQAAMLLLQTIPLALKVLSLKSYIAKLC